MPERGSHRLSRRHLLGAATLLPLLPIPSACAAQQEPPTSLSPWPAKDRRVGIGYSLWHDDLDWTHGTHASWGKPELGFYRSADPAIQSRHAAWLSGAKVDFVIADWSNDLDTDIRTKRGQPLQRYIEKSTTTLFDVWNLQPVAPRIAVMIGNPGEPAAVTDGKLRIKANEIHDLFVANPSRASRLETYLGKPLLLVYVNTPSPWQNGLPPWTDERFTVRFVTGFLNQQKRLETPSGTSRYGYWSWEDRHHPSYAVYDGHPECMTVVAAWRGSGSPGRNSGRTFIEQWSDARLIGPKFVVAGTFNEWWISEQIGVDTSKDIEPSVELHTQYLDLLRTQATLFKQSA